jgi:hypothetical protein
MSFLFILHRFNARRCREISNSTKLVWLRFAVFVIAECLSKAIEMPSWRKQEELEKCADFYGSEP